MQEMYGELRTIKSLLLTVICFLITLRQTTTGTTSDKFNVVPSSKSAFSPSSISTEVDSQTFLDKVGSSTNDRQNDEEKKEENYMTIEKTIIPFAQIAEIQQIEEERLPLLKTIESGVKFIEALKDQISGVEGDNDVEDIEELDSRAMRDGLEFFAGSRENLDSKPFFLKIKNEIFKFHSIPRFEEEILEFQMKIRERIKAFIDLNELVVVKLGEEPEMPEIESVPKKFSRNMITDEKSEHGFQNGDVIIADGIDNPEKGTEIIGRLKEKEKIISWTIISLSKVI